MKRSIEQKIAKLILGLQVRELDTLLANMVIIEQRIHKMPALLEWMEPRLSLDDSLQPVGFSNLYSNAVDSLVKLWIFVLQARYGNLAFRYVPALDLQSWGAVIVPDNLVELSSLKWLRVDRFPVGDIPSNLVLWVPATVYVSIPASIRQRYHWVLQLDTEVCSDLMNIVGIDGFESTQIVWDGWCSALDWSVIELCRVPPSIENVDFLHQTETLKVLDCSELEYSDRLADLDVHLSELQVLRMMNSNLRIVPAWLERSLNLRVLEIGWNAIQDLPIWMTNLNQLKHFNCAHTAFQHFPVAIFQHLALEQLIIRSVNSNVTMAWLTEVEELNSNCTVIRQRNYHAQSLWCSSLSLLG
jgi:hypothetical protein